MKIIIFADYFYPAYLAGGPIKSLIPIAKILSTSFEIVVITRNVDAYETKEFRNIIPNKISKLNGFDVFYTSDNFIGLIHRLLFVFKLKGHRLYYFNSFFSPTFSIIPKLFIKLLDFVRYEKNFFFTCPRGELNLSALKKKKNLKKFIIFLYRLLGDKRTYYHATNKKEKNDILNLFLSKKQNIILLEPLKEFNVLKKRVDQKKKIKEKGYCKLIFLSRILKIKGLHILLDALLTLKGKCDLDIYGPKDNCDYWNFCNNKIKTLNKIKPNLKINYLGSYNKDVTELLSNYDIFCLPTAGENFGHIIYESLAAGTPVITSDRTPIKANSIDGTTIIKYENLHLWPRALQKFIDLNPTEYLIHRNKALSSGKKFAESQDVNSKRYLEVFSHFSDMVD